jgi:hypothetical protein
MTINVTATYDDSRGRVLIAATNLPAIATTAAFEWSNDNVHWRSVRGSSAVPVASNAASCFDYEYSPGILNYYRVSAVSAAAPSFVAAGTAATANNASVTPALPAGWQEGDLLLILATIRNSGTGTVVAPTGYTALLAADNWALFGKRAAVAESAPTVTVTGGAAGADVLSQMAAWRNTELIPATTAYQLNPSGANITYPGVAAFQSSWDVILYLGWRQSSWTVPNVATISGATEIGEVTSTAGSGAGQVWDYQVQTTPAPVIGGAFTVTGGSAAISYGAVVALRSAVYVLRTTATVTPVQSQVWLKVPTAPYLNRTVTLIDWDDLNRSSRAITYSVIGKRDASAVTDMASPRTVNINLWTTGDAETAALDLLLSLGNIMLLSVPPNCALKSMYASLGNYKYTRPAHLSHNNNYTVPLTEVTMPDVSLGGNTVTWATLITNYATWQDVINANATWAAVLALSGTPADALVGH